MTPSHCRSREPGRPASSRSCSHTSSSFASCACSSVVSASLEDGARVGQRRVEHPREQLLAEVVVRGDVAPAPRSRAAVRPSPDRLDGEHERPQARPDAVRGAGVAGQEPDHGDRIGRVPEPVGVRIREPDAAAQDLSPRAGAVHAHQRPRLAGTVAAPPAAFLDGQRPATQAPQQRLDERTRGHARPGRRPGWG